MTNEAARAIEAVLMVATDPVDPHLLAQLLEVAPARIEELCDGLKAEYEASERGFVLVKVAGGYRFQSHADLAGYVERFVLEGQNARLSSAALETLAIVAYKQPLSRAQVAAIRGVNVDGVMRTLQQRGYVAEIGRDPGPGQATLFGTTSEFLERLGLDRIEDLPAISDLFPSPEVMEALELGLRAEPVDRNPSTPDAPPAAAEPTEGSTTAAAEPEVDAEPEPEPAETADAQAADIVAAAFADDDDDRPEPVPPAWAIDLTERLDVTEAGPIAQAEPVAGVDLDGDGEDDLPPVP